MKKSEMMAIIDKIDAWIAAAEAVRKDEPGGEYAYPELLTARLVAEQTLILAQMLVMMQKLPESLDDHAVAVVDAIVQRTWPGILAFEEDGPTPPASEEEDE